MSCFRTAGPSPNSSPNTTTTANPPLFYYRTSGAYGNASGHGAERETVRMKFGEKLKKRQYDQMWSEYCGFLDLDIDGYMRIQTRLMEEQIALWSGSALGAADPG